MNLKVHDLLKPRRSLREHLEYLLCEIQEHLLCEQLVQAARQIAIIRGCSGGVR